LVGGYVDNYTMIKLTLKDNTELFIDEDELVVFKLSGEYRYIEYLNDKTAYHRTDGPAVVWSNGRKSWWVDGRRHRTDGPAIEGTDGSKQWYVDGKLHRLDGPAVERADGRKYWWVDDKHYSKEEFEKLQEIK
jgi:hypothetical protein